MFKKMQLRARLTRSVYRLGSPCADFYGFLVLREGGHVFGYECEREALWRFEGADLLLLSSAGVVTSRFKPVYAGTELLWIGTHESRIYPMILCPIIEFQSSLCAAPLPPLIINSVPKSGTHFILEIARSSGWIPEPVMFTYRDRMDDYRRAGFKGPDPNPGSHGKICPLSTAVGALPNGIAIGTHSTDLMMFNAAAAVGVKVLNVVRDLRKILVSLFRFKVKHSRLLQGHAIEAKLPADQTEAEFLRFLAQDARDDLDLIGQSLSAILSQSQFPVVSYDDVLARDTGSRSWAELRNLTGRSSQEFTTMVDACSKKDTATSSGGGIRFESVWGQAAERFFERSGLKDLDREMKERLIQPA